MLYVKSFEWHTFKNALSRENEMFNVQNVQLHKCL